jgi:5-methylcytosine-specific restriction endonuclease McrA
MGGRCRRHQRPGAAARGYDREWSQLAAAWLRALPYCGQRFDGSFHMEHSYCARRGVRTKANVVDHIKRLAEGGARLDPQNLQSLCYSCNRIKR